MTEFESEKLFKVFPKFLMEKKQEQNVDGNRKTQYRNSRVLRQEGEKKSRTRRESPEIGARLSAYLIKPIRRWGRRRSAG